MAFLSILGKAHYFILSSYILKYNIYGTVYSVLLSKSTEEQMQDFSDDLLERASKGDKHAFEEIYKAFSGFVYNLVFKITGNTEDAQELTQDVFFTAYKSLKNFRAESKLSTWLYRIAVNSSMNFQRKNKLNRWLSLDFLLENKPDEIPHSRTGNPLKELERTEKEKIVLKAVNSLADNQRVAIILSRYENLPYGEIAKIMKCSVPSVESFLFRAKQNLSKKLAQIVKDL